MIIKKQNIIFVTPVPYTHLSDKEGQEDLVIVSLEQLIKAQKDFENRLSQQRKEIVDKVEKIIPQLKIKWEKCPIHDNCQTTDKHGDEAISYKQKKELAKLRSLK